MNYHKHKQKTNYSFKINQQIYLKNNYYIKFIYFRIYNDYT